MVERCGDGNNPVIDKTITILLKHDLCVGGLARQLDISKPAVSQHLQVLRKIGLLTGEKKAIIHITLSTGRS
jgi:DNA-binding transcriptional ArsR family regulator